VPPRALAVLLLVIAALAAPAPAWGQPEPVAHAAAGFQPNDPGKGAPGDWSATQWNFAGPWSVNAPEAWTNLLQAGAPGGRGALVAVLDTGVAYRDAGRHRRSPDFSAGDFVRGWDFVDRDPHPDDHNGHGTHVASTIGAATNNRVGLTGLAYGARILPVRVLDDAGEGRAATIARGVRYAARRGADVINLSLEFGPEVTARDIRGLLKAVSAARRSGSLVVGAAGNGGQRRLAWPARHRDVLAVGATTERGCRSDYSNEGPGLDLAAPGGGADAAADPDPRCRPQALGRPIVQLTYQGSRRRFGYPSIYEGTSMAAPHVSAAAALVIASRVLGRNPSPRAVETRLERTARDLGAPGRDQRFGAGLVDAAAATRR
jgi:serine protease